VELVEQHAADPRERRVALRLAQEHALGHEADPRARAHRPLEARLEADLLAELAPELLRHAARRHARGEAARLEHDDLALDHPRAEHDLGHLRRLAAAGGRGQHHRARAHRGDDGVGRAQDGQLGGRRGLGCAAHCAQYRSGLTGP
jgi:hypothetical protein